MTKDVYKLLAKALDALPNGFPRTPSNIEILILKKIFSFEEAWLGSQLSGAMEPVQDIARRVGLSKEETQISLSNMAKRGLIWRHEHKGKTHFRLAPFIVGIYEAQLESMDHEPAHLFEQFMLDGGAAGIMKPQPAIHRVIPDGEGRDDEFTVRVATTLQEDQEFIGAGFEYVTNRDGAKIYRKRK